MSPSLIAKIIVAADVRGLKFPYEQSFISGLLTSAAASLTGCEGRYYTSFSPTDERFQSRTAHTRQLKLPSFWWKFGRFLRRS